MALTSKLLLYSEHRVCFRKMGSSNHKYLFFKNQDANCSNWFTDSNVSRKCRYLIEISIYQINEKVTGGETISDYPLTLQEKQLQSAIL